MKNQFSHVWSRPDSQFVCARKRSFYANYFTIFFSLGLFLTPSVLSAQTCSGNAFAVVSQTGVDNPTNALGGVNGTAAQLWDTGDQIVLDLNAVVNTGSTLVLTWRGNTISSADPTITVETSLNGTTFTAVSGSPLTIPRTAAYFTNNITAPSAVRYIRLTTTTTFNVDLDALTYTNQTCSPICGTNTAGTVWRDYNSDGIKSANEDQGVSGITVKAFDCNNVLAETATTNAKGEYAFTSLTPSTTNKYRIEFSGGTPQYQPTLNGSNGKTDVQFISAASCFVDFGVNASVDYCQSDPPLMINCYVTGAYNGTGATGLTIVGLPYSYAQDPDGNTNGMTATGNPVSNTGNPAIYTPARPAKTPIAAHNEIGSTWGLAYDRDQRNLFAAAYVKSGTSLGPNNESTGKIFKINNPLSASTVSDYVDLNAVFGANTAGVNPHPSATTDFSALNDVATNRVIGKVGLGDLAISNDNAFLYTVNLADRKLYKIPTSGALNSTTISRFDIPTTNLPTVINAAGTAGTCPVSDMRPFGLGVNPDGNIYVGAVCSAESLSSGYNAEPNNASYQLTAYVWKFDGSAFTLVLNSSLRFDRDGGNGYTTGDDFTKSSPRQLDWEPWHDLSIAAIYDNPETAQNEPMLADISFDERGDMFMGVRDRRGDCVMLYGGYLSSGDIYKANKTATGFTMESNATSGSDVTAGVNNMQGPGGGEFIFSDLQGDEIVNSGTGGVFNLIGRNQTVSTAVDAVYLNSSGQVIFNPNAGGIQIFGSRDGALKGAYNLYESNDLNTFAKAAGIGAIAALCVPAPIEIGNYVWIDTDSDGVQDPCETPLSNITVKLYKMDGGTTSLVATTTTNASGNYYFKDYDEFGTSGYDTLQAGKMYFVVLEDATFNKTTNRLTNGGNTYQLTTKDATAANGNDQNDSDAAIVASGKTFDGYPANTVTIPTNAAGYVNHTLDFGFKPAACVVNITPSVSGCYQNGDASKATVSIEISWENATVSPTANDASDAITVTFGGQTRTINPGAYTSTGGNGTIVSPQVVAFEVDADASTQTIQAFFGADYATSTCKDEETSVILPAACPPSTCTGDQSGGTVFNDSNADGTKQAGETQGLAGVTVKAFGCNGVEVATTTTNAVGKYTFAGLTAANYPIRVEFSNLPTLYGNGTPYGADGNTTIQFIAAANCNVDLGVLDPNDYCQDNPKMVIPCYVQGVSSGNTNDALVMMNYDASGLVGTFPVIHAATANQVGALWGVAFNKQNKTFYSSAVLRRHSGYGPLGIGGIYKTDLEGSTTSWIDVTAAPLNINLGSNFTRQLSIAVNPDGIDSVAFERVGKNGIGDIDISEDGKHLWFVNLFTKELVKLDTNGTTATAFAIPNPNCTNGVFRPWALKPIGGKVLVGGVCDANTGTRSDLRAYVYEFNVATSTFNPTPIFDFLLTYPKGFMASPYPNFTSWERWTDNFDEALSVITGTAPNQRMRVFHPTPLLSDIEVDIDGALILALGDRTSFQIQPNNFRPNPSTVSNFQTGNVAGGDLLRAAKLGNVYILENNAKVGHTTGVGVNNNQGPGFGEFYNDDFTRIRLEHAELALGALALKPGSGEVLATVVDPINVPNPNTTNPAPYTNANGVRFYNNTTGNFSDAFQVYNGVVTQGFDKAAGIGDIEISCGIPQYLQVGNYAWIDTDKDGVQDPCETPLSNVTLSLWKNGVQIASTTTGSNGEYYFSSKSALADPNNWTGTGADTTLLPNMAYEVRIDTAAQVVIFDKLALTLANATTNTGNDQNDNDATTSGIYKVITFTTGAAGSTNHTLDFGFYPFCTPPTIAATTATSATCTSGAANNDAAVTVSGIVGMEKYAYRTNATDSLWANTATASTASSINLTGIANSGSATTYTFRIWGADTTCFNDTTVVLNPSACTPCSITATLTQNACNNNGTTSTAADDYFTITVSAVSAISGGASGKYEVVLNGTVLNTGGTTYGTSVTVGTTTTFKSDGATTYNLTVRDFDMPTCVTTTFTTAVSSACSTVDCKPVICLPVTVTKF